MWKFWKEMKIVGIRLNLVVQQLALNKTFLPYYWNKLLYYYRYQFSYWRIVPQILLTFIKKLCSKRVLHLQLCDSILGERLVNWIKYIADIWVHNYSWGYAFLVDRLNASTIVRLKQSKTGNIELTNNVYCISHSHSLYSYTPLSRQQS